MRNLTLFLLLLQVAVPIKGVKSATVNQLDQILKAARQTPDARLAHELSDLELSERLSSDRLSRWSADLTGPDSRRSPIVLADMSAFLDLPSDLSEAQFKKALLMQWKNCAFGNDAPKTLANFL